MLITEKKEKVMGPSGHWESMTFTQSKVEEVRTEAAQRSGELMQAITTLHITGLQLLLFALCPPHPSCITRENPIQGSVLCRTIQYSMGKK